MNVPILDLTRQYLQIKDKVEPAVMACLSSGMYILGKTVADFEHKMAKYLGVKHVITVANGTDSLVIALRACGVKRGDEVITTPFTFFATAEAISIIGAIPVFVDIEEKHFNIDAKKIEEKITSKTKAILPVHIFGHPVDMDTIKMIGEKYNLKVIEDACQAIGAEYKGKKVGGLGDAACFSFFPTKNLGAFGDAGMITTNCDDIATICRALREHGAGQNGAKSRWMLEGISDELADTEGTDELYNPYKYFNYIVGYNSRMDAIQATILNVKLDYLDEFNKKRKKIADFYKEQLKETNFITPQSSLENKSVWHQYAIRTTKKEELGSYLSQNQIGSGAFYPIPLHLQKAFEYLGYKRGDLPTAEKIANETVCLPIFPELTQDEIHYIVDKLKEFNK